MSYYLKFSLITLISIIIIFPLFSQNSDNTNLNNNISQDNSADTIIYVDDTGKYFKNYKDKRGLIFKVEEYDENNNMICYYIYTYNSDGEPTSLTRCDDIKQKFTK